MGLIPRQSLTVTRYAGGSKVNGKWVEGTPSTFTINASVQPLTPKEIELLPEGRRASGENYKLYADPSPILKTVSGDENPDKISIYSQDFEVFSIERWENSIISHIKYIVTRVTSK